jgi:hypothetical protein
VLNWKHEIPSWSTRTNERHKTEVLVATLDGTADGAFEGVLLGSKNSDGFVLGVFDGPVEGNGVEDGFLLGNFDGVFEGALLGSTDREFERVVVFDGSLEGSFDGEEDGSLLSMLDGIDSLKHVMAVVLIPAGQESEFSSSRGSVDCCRLRIRRVATGCFL